MVFTNYHYAPRLQVFFCVFLRCGKPPEARKKGAELARALRIFSVSLRIVVGLVFALYSILGESAYDRARISVF